MDYSPQEIFQKDLDLGEVAADIVLKLYNPKYPFSEKIVGKESRYDIAIKSGLMDTDFMIEVKFDIASWVTGNVAIEVADRGKPSGVSVTEAKYWAILYRDIEWRMAFPTPKQLKYFLWKENARVVRGAGREKSTIVKLLKADTLTKNIRNVIVPEQENIARVAKDHLIEIGYRSFFE